MQKSKDSREPAAGSACYRMGRSARRRSAVWLAPTPPKDETIRLVTPAPHTSGALALVEERAYEPAVPAAKAPACVLIVEDDPHVAGLLRQAFELDDYASWTIDVITNGGAAVRRAREARPNIVLLDVHLPDMDGAEVYRCLRAAPATVDCQIIFLTGSNSLDLSTRGVDGGILLRKPFDVEAVIALVKAILQEP